MRVFQVFQPLAMQLERGIVDQDVDAAEGVDGGGDGRLHLLFLAEVALQGQALATGRRNRLGRAVDGARQLRVRYRRLGGDGHVGARMQ
ncbi:hypothetical protein G6F66_013573 [Rhizopus arrhizus]|nr:hypothetical protein G6F66_013573 [Rhizopus arrhizus]